MAKLTKEEEKRALGAIGKVISGISKIQQENEKEIINEMVASMKVQALIMAKARVRGIDVSVLLPKIKIEYEKQK